MSEITKTPKLKQLDLSKGEGHNHPDIVPYDKCYLVKIGKDYFAGTFSKEWYGLNFNDWGTSGLQYDKPGTNSSDWKAVWEIVEK